MQQPLAVYQRSLERLGAFSALCLSNSRLFPVCGMSGLERFVKQFAEPAVAVILKRELGLALLAAVEERLGLRYDACVIWMKRARRDEHALRAHMDKHDHKQITKTFHR